MSEKTRDKALALTCEEFEATLDGYLAGEDEPGFLTHAGSCGGCGALLADIESIHKAAADLPLESPSPRVWSNVRATLSAEGFFEPKPSFWEKLIAQLSLSNRTVPLGAAVLLIALAMVLFSPGSLQKKATTSGAPSVVASSPVPSPSLTAVESNLAQTVQRMEQNYRVREADLDPVAKQTYDRGLSSLDSSIHECLISLRSEPENTLARRYLVQAYTEKADILASALEYDGR